MDCSTPDLPVPHSPEFAQVHVHCVSDLSFFFFLIFSLKPPLLLSFFTLIKRLFSSSSLSAIRVVSCAYLRLLMFLLSILIPACNSSRLAFLLICSAYRLNKQGDIRQPCRPSFLTLNQSFVTYKILAFAS